MNIAQYLENYVLPSSSELPFESGTNCTLVEDIRIGERPVRKFINEFWTARQRQASSIHEISYRACFKPQLPRFFIKLLSKEGDVVYDPFSGRGTTVIEAGLLGRSIIANDINPLSRILTEPRYFVPALRDLEIRLEEIPFRQQKAAMDLDMFFHPDTLSEIISIREYLRERKTTGKEDSTDRWIRMVATNRLTGHSGGFFSVYTLPPNQAVSPESQRKINRDRNQRPDYRDTRELILRKSRSLLRNLSGVQAENLRRAGESAVFLNNDARQTSQIPEESVQLTVTSPPFLNIVQYSKDNWLRCWFNDIDARGIEAGITMSKTVSGWEEVMGGVFRELYRITRPGGWVTFEVGEVKNGSVRLDEHVVPLGIAAGFSCEGILINQQEFTKTSNIWGIRNNNRGTNTNRIVLFQKLL